MAGIGGLLGGVAGGIFGGPLGASLGGALGTSVEQMFDSNQIKPQYTPYQISDAAKQRLGLAQQMYNGRMAGAVNQEQNIANNQANTIANAARGASNGAQLLSLAGSAQGQSNQAYNNLAMQEAQNKAQMAQNLNGALDNMSQEEYKVYQDKLNQYQTQMQQKSALTNAGLTNGFNALNGLYSANKMGDFGGTMLGGLLNGKGMMKSSAASTPLYNFPNNSMAEPNYGLGNGLGSVITPDMRASLAANQ